MTERSIFLAALEYDDPAERLAYLDRACAGEPTLRAQVEQLLTAHEQSGSFLGRPAHERLAGDLAAGPDADGTRTSPAADANEPLDFLTPSDKAGSLGRRHRLEVAEVVLHEERDMVASLETDRPVEVGQAVGVRLELGEGQ